MSQFEGQAQGYPAETGRVVYAEPLEAGSCFTDDSNPKNLNHVRSPSKQVRASLTIQSFGSDFETSLGFRV